MVEARKTLGHIGVFNQFENAFGCVLLIQEWIRAVRMVS